ncbi:hypothetical protein ACFPPD_09380 [Cohnella suwonensis]|uniref:Uncharacterized protein n=1 Tax=Cohnella suwonensis TaxID=696072 RepID=A0ABW0LT31_9BACL
MDTLPSPVCRNALCRSREPFLEHAREHALDGGGHRPDRVKIAHVEAGISLDPRLKESEAIVEWSKKKDGPSAALLVTRNADDVGVLEHAQIMRIPALAYDRCTNDMT